MFDHIMPAADEAVYAPAAPARISAEMAIRILTDYASVCEITDARITRVVTGYGTYTAHHFDDSDYVVTLTVHYADMPDRECEAIYGVRGNRADLWAN